MRMGNAHPQVVPYQDFQASDGSFMLAANNDDQFRRLCDAVGLSELADDDRFRDNAARVQHREMLAGLLNEKIRRQYPRLLDGRIAGCGDHGYLDQHHRRRAG